MTGDDDGDRIRTVGHADSAYRFGISDLFGELQIGDGFSVGDSLQLSPHAQLKRCAVKDEREIERLPLPSEVFAELLLGGEKRGARSVLMRPFDRSPGCVGILLAPSLDKPDLVKTPVVAHEQKRAYRAFKSRV